MSKPFFTGDELWSGPKRPIPGDSDSWDALAEYCNSKVAPLLEALEAERALRLKLTDMSEVASLRALLAQARGWVEFCSLRDPSEAELFRLTAEIDAMLGDKV